MKTFYFLYDPAFPTLAAILLRSCNEAYYIFTSYNPHVQYHHLRLTVAILEEGLRSSSFHTFDMHTDYGYCSSLWN